MAKRKKRRSNKKKSASAKQLKPQLLRIFTGISILILLVVCAGLIARHFLFRKPPVPSFEIYPKENIPSREIKPITPGHLPKVVIILDDLGYDKKIAQKFINLNAELTFSILPQSPFQKIIATSAHQKGYEVMLHLPMEPFEYPVINPGKGALLSAMSPDELIGQLEKDINAVPYIKGVNNHMGSKITSTSTQMYQIFSILKKKNLYFIDSRTTAKTLCKPSARLLQLPFSQRDIFLDNIHEPDAIREQLKKLVDLAKKHGDAVGIAHPHPATYSVLREMLPKLKKEVQLVPASGVVHVES
jgi:uncharacterized protein